MKRNLVSILLIRLTGVLIVGWYLRLGLAAVWIVLAGELVIRGLLIYGRFLHGGWKRVEV
jgi:Na+-driven multidrug efflux pump